jgi:hypothetical protein
LYAEANRHDVGITGVANQLIFHDANIEFLAIGSCVHRDESKTGQVEFSTAADGQSLYIQINKGFCSYILCLMFSTGLTLFFLSGLWL